MITSDPVIAVRIQGDYAYAITNVQGMQVYDITEPSNLVELAQLEIFDYPSGLQVAGDYAYVIDFENGLFVIDISDPANPVETGFIETGLAQGVAIAGDYAYVAYGEDVSVVDISDPTAPVEVSTFGTSEAFNIDVAGDYAYVASWVNGLRIFNVSNPSAPEFTGSWETETATFYVTVVGNYAFLSDADGAMRLIDVSDPANPVLAGFYDTPGDLSEIAVVGNYAITANGNFVGAYDCSEVLATPEHNPEVVPQSVELHPCYPNPFNPSTTISFSLPNVQRVSLTIYNLAGQTVETLLEGRQSAGRHQVEFNGAGLSSGMYFYMLQTGEYTATRKMMLLK
jgi:hypothetical protein